MSGNKYTHTFTSGMKWLKSRKSFLQGVLSAVLVSVFAFMVTDDLSNAYVLLHMKEPQIFLLKEIVVMDVESSSSAQSEAVSSANSSSSEASLRPAAPEEQSSSSETSVPASNESSAASTIQSSASSAQSSSVSSVSSISSISSIPSDDFPAFGNAIMPVSRVPNWGDMRTPEEWNRTYGELGADDFVKLPSYNLRDLTSKTMEELQETRNDPDSIALLTEKLAYSTRYFGAYDLDATEFTGIHPGIDIKLADGTPIGSVAGGKVSAVIRKEGGLGLHVIIEHRLADGSQYFSIYGHLQSVSVSEGDTVAPGSVIGKVGMTGKTTAPHLHLQIDKGTGETSHTPYMPNHLPSRSEASRFVVNPIVFISQY